MSVGDICNREVVIIGKDAEIRDAARLMRDHHIGALVVTEARKGVETPIGILTDRDLVIEVIAKGVVLESVLVGDVMSFDLQTAHEADGIWDTLQRMRIKGIRRIPVVNDQGGLEGILALDDLLELLSDELSQISQLISREQRLERSLRP